MRSKHGAWGRRGIVAACCLFSLSVWAQSAAPVDTLASLATSRTLTLGVRTDAAPFSYVDAAGRPGGFSWALCRAVVAQLEADLGAPITVKFQAVSLAESFTQLRDGGIDLHCGITTNTSERAQVVDFSNTFYVSRVVAAHRKQDTHYADEREFGRTGVLQGSTAQQLMRTYATNKVATRSLGPVTAVPSYTDAVRLLKSGAIDTLVADELLIPADAAIATRRKHLTVEPYALVMRKGDKGFVEAVDRALARVLKSPQGRKLAETAGLKVDHMTQDAWRNPNKQPAPPVL
jgi:glutamate/aspartate transport system substrate-binding protein